MKAKHNTIQHIKMGMGSQFKNLGLKNSLKMGRQNDIQYYGLGAVLIYICI
jgi:hypothetical protein